MVTIKIVEILGCGKILLVLLKVKGGTAGVNTLEVSGESW